MKLFYRSDFPQNKSALTLLSILLLAGCGSQAIAPLPPLSIPASCTSTQMLTAITPIVEGAVFIDTPWQPAPGTELADFLNNNGIACSYGLQSAEIGTTVKWVKDSGSLFSNRIESWKSEGYESVLVKGADQAFFLHKLQSATQEFNVWALNITYRGYWIQISSSFSHTFAEGAPLITAALSSLESA